MTNLVVGGDSEIGLGIKQRLISLGSEVIATSRGSSGLYLDLSQDISGWNVPDNVRVAFLCAAITSIRYCEEDPGLSYLVNVVGLVGLAQKLVERGVFVVFLSSNAVFDGSKPRMKVDDPIAPVTQYGKQKAIAESLLLEMSDDIAIVRLTKVLSSNNKLLRGWKQDLMNKCAIFPYANLMMAPISLDFAVGVLLKIADSRLGGFWQVSALYDVSYAAAACYLADHFLVDRALVQPRLVDRNEINYIPSYTSLDCSRLVNEFALEVPLPELVLKGIF